MIQIKHIETIKPSQLAQPIQGADHIISANIYDLNEHGSYAVALEMVLEMESAKGLDAAKTLAHEMLAGYFRYERLKAK